MNLKNSLFIFVSLCLLAGATLNASAQKYEKAKEVEYFQLPAFNDTYKTANVFVMQDNALTNGSEIGGGEEKKGFDLGKFAGKLGDKIGGKKPTEERTKIGKQIAKLKLGEAMEKAVRDAMKPKATPHETWNLFPPHFSNGKGELKVVVTYCPYENSRPMSPQKNNKGLYVIPYKVFAHVKVFDASNKLITDHNFGLISGIGYSRKWPEGGSKMIQITDEGENAHPYEDVCLDGALEQARKVVYGMYGIKKFNETLGVYSFKDIKESKDYANKYEKLIERKGEALLNASEINEMKSLVAYWNGLMNQVPVDEKWAIHHNLAMGYAWLLDAAKTKEHVTALKKAQKPTFDKIQKFFSGNAEKGTFIGTKDMNRLEAFNACYPFMEYYAAGVNKHPSWPSILDKPYEEILYTFTMNNLVAGVADLPFPLPIIPSYDLKSSPKKVSGAVYKNGEVMMEYEYKLKKGKIESVDISTPKGKGKVNKSVAFRDIFADGSDDGSIGKATYILRGVRAHKPLGVTPKGYYMSIKMKNAITQLPFDYKDLKYWTLDGSVDVDFIPNSDNFKLYNNSGVLYLQGGSWNQCGGKVSMTATDADKNNYPESVTVAWYLWGYKNSQDANNFLKNQVSGSKWDAKKGVQTYNTSKTYKLDWKINGNGDWTEVTFGDYKVTRSL